MVKRWVVFLFGVLSYVAALAAFVYLVAFCSDLLVPRTVDGPSAAGGWTALAVDVGLVVLFGAQHSVMARPATKRRLVRLLPAAAERSLFVLLTAAVLAVLFALWRPLPGSLWDAAAGWPHAVLSALAVVGWSSVLLCTFHLGHFDLLGLRQVSLHLRGRPYRPLAFTEGGAYVLVRHPLMVAFLLAFWLTPVMGWGHLLLSAAMTGYILVGITFEERDLLRRFGESYRAYRARVPMLVPGLAARGSALLGGTRSEADEP